MSAFFWMVDVYSVQAGLNSAYFEQMGTSELVVDGERLCAAFSVLASHRPNLWCMVMLGSFAGGDTGVGHARWAIFQETQREVREHVRFACEHKRVLPVLEARRRS